MKNGVKIAPPASSTWIVLPTYNEAGSIAGVLRGLRAAEPEADLLVVDDRSPDGTADCVREAFGTDRRVHLLVREGARGRGRAGVDGFRFALTRGAGRVVEMDADGSHLPGQVPELLAGLSRAPIVLASRFLPGARDARGPARRALTRIANAWLRHALSLPGLDCTTGFRAFEARVLTEIPWNEIRSEGPGIVQEVLARAVRRGFSVHQIPIRFQRRQSGRSKLDLISLLRVLAGSWRAGRDLRRP